VQLHGPTFDDVQSQGDVFTEAVLRAINRILSDVSQTLHGFISLDDVNVIRKKWTQEVDQTLLDHVGAAHMAGASITRINQHTALVKILGGHTASALVASPETPSTNPFQIPVVENTSATEGLTNARNRLLGVGDHVWETARSQLLEGLHNGEGVTALRDRVASAGELSSARAEVVARSETAYAMNHGSLDQMTQLTAVSVVKEWIAVDDDRTRVSHAEVNGEKVPIDSVFSNGEDPGDEPNCRCTLGFSIPDDDVAGHDLETGEPISSEDSFVQQACGCSNPDLVDSLTAGPYDTGAVRRSEGLTSPCSCDTDLAGDAEFKAVFTQAQEKIAAAPVPSEQAVQKARAELEKARTAGGRAGGESRGGSAAARRKQRYNLFVEFGGDKRGYVVCHGCGLKIHWADPGSAENPHGFARFERGKIFVKCQGGGYQLQNLLPECFSCNRSRNSQLLRHENHC
jgi:SPP1 gp7 family putative phage head morphogenesis protein